jgi:hypothetical protein
MPPTRPALQGRQTSVQTRYMEMLLAVDTIPRLHNILSSFFTWLLLAGFLVFPGTFTSIQQLETNPNFQSKTDTEILNSVKHVSLLIVAGISSGLGALGMIWLWWRWRQNFVWLLNKIFLPGAMNSFAGLISTLINVYSQENGEWVSYHFLHSFIIKFHQSANYFPECYCQGYSRCDWCLHGSHGIFLLDL